MNEQKRTEILHARAIDLAIKPFLNLVDTIEILVFRVMDETYGLQLSSIGEVYPLKDLTPIPCTPTYILGVINIRGRILCVVDLYRIFGMPSRGFTERDSIVTLSGTKVELGFITHAVIGTMNISVKSIQRSLPTINGRRGEYLKGITDDGIIILDSLKLVQDKNLIVHEDVR